MENKMIFINGEIISLNNIWNISKIENKDERIILINYVVDGKIIRYDLDYSDVKDDVNEEKTILEKKIKSNVDYDGKYVIKKDQITKETETASLLPILDLIQLNVNVKGELPTKGNLEIEKSNVLC